MKSYLFFLFLFFPALAFAADPIRPNPALTPGAVLTTDIDRICAPDYTKTVRHTTHKTKLQVYHEYGITPRKGGYEIDHLIPLCLGGADTKDNLWPESYHSRHWNAQTKDRLELKLHDLVCAKKLDVKEAQNAFANDWIAAYKRFCPTKKECPSYMGRVD